MKFTHLQIQPFSQIIRMILYPKWCEDHSMTKCSMIRVGDIALLIKSTFCSPRGTTSVPSLTACNSSSQVLVTSSGHQGHSHPCAYNHTQRERKKVTNKIFNFLNFYFTCINVYLHVCECTSWVQCPKRPEEDIESLKLELQMIVSYPMHAGPQTWVLCKSTKWS